MSFEKTCRVCGKKYDACRTTSRELGAFTWRSVACSPECATEYFRAIEDSRNDIPAKVEVVEDTSGKIVEVSDEFEKEDAPKSPIRASRPGRVSHMKSTVVEDK